MTIVSNCLPVNQSHPTSGHFSGKYNFVHQQLNKKTRNRRAIAMIKAVVTDDKDYQEVLMEQKEEFARQEAEAEAQMAETGEPVEMVLVEERCVEIAKETPIYGFTPDSRSHNPHSLP